MSSQFLTLKEASRVVGVHRITITKAIESGKLKASRIGKRILISPTHLSEYMGAPIDMDRIEKMRNEEELTLPKVDKIYFEYDEDVVHIMRGETSLFSYTKNAMLPKEYSFLLLIKDLIRHNVSQEELKQIYDIIKKEYGS